MTPDSIDPRHHERMKALVAYTAASFATDHPSPFGAAVYDAQTGGLIAQAYDSVIAKCDPTNHGEVNAVRLATQKLARLSLRGCVLYSTCEPCPMCMSACIWAELETVVYGASTLEDADPYWPQPSDVTPQELAARMRVEPRCEVIAHVERELCRDLFQQCDDVRQERGLGLPPNR